jgi:hypothetical protein
VGQHTKGSKLSRQQASKTRRHQQDKATPARGTPKQQSDTSKRNQNFNQQPKATYGWLGKTLRVSDMLNAGEGKPTVAVADQNTPRRSWRPILEEPQPLSKLNKKSRRNTSVQNSAKRECECSE